MMIRLILALFVLFMASALQAQVPYTQNPFGNPQPLQPSWAEQQLYQPPQPSPLQQQLLRELFTDPKPAPTPRRRQRQPGIIGNIYELPSFDSPGPLEEYDRQWKREHKEAMERHTDRVQREQQAEGIRRAIVCSRQGARKVHHFCVDW